MRTRFKHSQAEDKRDQWYAGINLVNATSKIILVNFQVFFFLSKGASIRAASFRHKTSFRMN